MLDKLISGKPVTKLTDSFFRIFEILLRLTTILLKIIKKLVSTTLSRRADLLLSKAGRHLVSNLTTVDPNTIVFTTVQGEYTCNPKYIAEEIIRRKLPYNITWVLRGNALGPFPPEFNLVRDKSSEYYRIMAKARVVVQNGHSMQKNDVQKNKGQYWIQTWHGSLGLKRLENAGGDSKFYAKMQKLDNRDTDYIISNSEFEDNVYRGSYWAKTPIKRLGHARTDILFETPEKTIKYLRKKVLKRLNIEDKGQKFLLFAPTHDDKNPYQAFGNLDLDKMKLVLSEKFGGNWEILIRTHNNNKNKSSQWLAGLPVYCHNASFYPDIQELLVVSDIGLTDYSSWVCDYIYTRKPSFLFGPNIRKYEKNRGFYHKFEDTPFTIATTNDELLSNISNFDQKKYENKIDDFLDRCKSVDDGKSSARIVDEIENLMKINS